MPTNAARAPLVDRLRHEARRAREDLGPFRTLDVGYGSEPYEPLFAPFASSYVAIDSAEASASSVASPHRGARARLHARRHGIPRCADQLLALDARGAREAPARERG